MSYNISDFTRCPEYSCDDGNVGVDYFFDGERLFFNFYCDSCGCGSLEDDFRWYVRCPNCNPSPDGGVDHIEGEIKDSGMVKFICTECEADCSDYISTRWDENDKEPIFEPRNY